MRGAVVVAVRGVWVCACVRAVGGAHLTIVRRDASVVVIIRTREALQVRERVSLSADTNGRRGWPAVVRRGRVVILPAVLVVCTSMMQVISGMTQGRGFAEQGQRPRGAKGTM